MIENIKLGPLEGYSALILIAVLAIAVVLIVAVLIASIVKAVKERKDENEDAQEDAFYAEYGVTGEELRLNEKLARMRGILKHGKRKDFVDDEPAQTAPQPEPVKEEPVAEETKADEPAVQEPVEEPKTEVAEEKAEEVKAEETPQEPIAQPEPEKEEEPAPVVEEKKEEPAPEPVQEPVKEEPTPEPQKEEAKEEPKAEAQVEPQKEEASKPEPVPQKQGVDKPATKKVVKKKPDDWSKYDGTYEGYYYDPEDACYYEGTPSPALAKKLAAKEAELEALNANKDKKVVIKKVAPPFAALKTPKNARKAPQKVAGFDESVIYGKYVIEHVDKEDGTQEYFYTLYDASGKDIYESSNYTTKAYCERAINRFKTHALIGTYTIEAAEGKFFFVIKRKTYVHKGAPQVSFDDANALMKQVKAFAQTDIVREQ